MKIHTKILSTMLISGCFLNQNVTHAAPVNAYVGASMGFQRGWGPLKGGTLIDGRPLGFGLATVSYSGRMGQSDPAGTLFFEIDTKINNCFSLGLRPYYHLDTFEATIRRNGDLDALDPGGGNVEIVNFSMRRRHAYGLLFVPKMYLKEVAVYGLFGAEFSRFKGKIDRSLIDPATILPLTFSKGMSSSAAVIGLGVSRELGNWSLFAEGQYKHYRAKKFEVNYTTDAGFPTSQFLKFSPRFASVMFGVKFKFI